MKLKKFNQFIKENLSEDVVPDERDLELEEPFDNIDDFESALGNSKDEEQDGYVEGEEDYSRYEEDDDQDEYDRQVANNADNFSGDEGTDIGDDGEEEEGYEYKGTLLMNELADKLGTQVVNNKIDYNGQEINYYSETEKFHIGKSKFDTIEEVLDFLGTPDTDDSNIEDPIEDSPVETLESRRFIKRF
jgi:hypothetical protein